MKTYVIKIKFYNTIILEFEVRALSEQYAKDYSQVIIDGLWQRKDKLEAIITEV